jgi:hypothetical protein
VLTAYLCSGSSAGSTSSCCSAGQSANIGLGYPGSAALAFPGNVTLVRVLTAYLLLWQRRHKLMLQHRPVGRHCSLDSG